MNLKKIIWVLGGVIIGIILNAVTVAYSPSFVITDAYVEFGKLHLQVSSPNSAMCLNGYKYYSKGSSVYIKGFMRMANGEETAMASLSEIIIPINMELEEIHVVKKQGWKNVLVITIKNDQ